MKIALFVALAIIISFVSLGAAMLYEEKKDGVDMALSFALVVTALCCAFAGGWFAA